MPETTITRSEVVVIASVSSNEYGDLLFTDKEGVERKVGNKRVSYFKDVIIVGKAVQLNYAMAYNKEYIYNAKLVEGELPPETKPDMLHEHKEVVKKAVAETITHDKKDRAVSLSYAKDLACHKIIGVADMPRWADQFLKYIEDRKEE